MSPERPLLAQWISNLKDSPPFFRFAAWYSLIAPFLAAAFALLVFHAEGPYNRAYPAPFPNQDHAEDIAFLICLSSLILGITSLSGIQRHGLKGIVWKAALGISVSVIFGICALVCIAGRIARQ